MYRMTALTVLIVAVLTAGFFSISPTFGVDAGPVRTAMLPRAHAAAPESQPFSQGEPAVGVYLLGMRAGLRTSEPFREAEPAVGATDRLVFSAPPRETPAEGARLYQPLADYLSQALGRRVTYRHPGTWGVYRTEVLEGKYDLVFDDPHLTSYHAEKHGYHSIVKFSEHFQYAVVVRSDYVFKSVARLRGQTFCTFAPPNLGTLVLLSLFDNPTRQPVLLSVNSWEEAYQGVVSGQCVGGVIPLPMARKLDPDNRQLRVVFNSTEFPHQAVSAGPRLSAEERNLIRVALVGSGAAEPTAKLRAQWNTPNGFVPAANEEYAGLSDYLTGEWGFY